MKNTNHLPVSETPYTIGTIANGPPCCEPETHLSIQNLGIGYGDQPVLEQVSLDIYKGCITALIGPSGCGKTSFLSSLNRLTEFTPSAKVTGNVMFRGQNILSGSIDLLTLRRRIGMVFQRPNPFPLSIRQNLALPLKEHGIKSRQLREEKIVKAFQQVGLWNEVADRLDSPALALSGGQQQRLCIARALVLEPEILLMDEPCSALDPMSSAVVEELILRLQGHYTIVIVTHNLAQAKRVANYAAFFWMREQVGNLIEFGKCQRIFESPRHELTAAYVSGVSG